MALIDLEKSRELKGLVETLTHSGSKDLNKEELNYVLKLCCDKPYLAQMEDEIMSLLKKNHSEVRYSTVQLVHELFMKFEDFRNFILKRIDEFFQLTLALESINVLPPPKAAAKALRKLSLSNLLIWEKSFPIPKLKRALNYLENVEHVDFRSLEVVDPKERKEKEEWELRMSKIMKERLKKMNEEIEDLMPEIRSTVTSLGSCFELLMPLPASEEVLEPSSSFENGDMRVFGVLNAKHFVQIELANKVEIKVSDENSALIDAAKDAFTLINNSFLPKVKAWVEIINKAEGGDSLMKKAMKLKAELEAMVFKYNQIEIVKEGENNIDDDDLVSSDSDLEEVPEMKKTAKDLTEDEIHFLSPTLGLAKKEKKKVKESEEKDELAAGPSRTSSGSDRKEQLLAVAPKLPFDVDLYHWEDEKLPTPTMLAVSSEGSRFWGGGGSEELQEIPVPDGAALLRTRVIEFTGAWEPVDHTCRAPLPSGKLCPRQDRVKCPFHGIIVPRDERGKIINIEDEEKVAKSKPKPDIPDWQDPKLLAEIKAQTGVDLKMPEKGKRRKKYPGLTDLKEMQNTSEHRLSKKVFNKKSLKRVAQTLDKIDHKRHRDKFGDQFNYVHGT